MNKIIPIFIKNGRNHGKQAGFYNVLEKTYYKDIIWKKHHMIQPRFSGLCFVSNSVIKDLEKLGCKLFKFRIIGHEKKSYTILIIMSEFIEHAEVNAYGDDTQYATPFDKFTRVYDDQLSLGELK